MILPRRQSIQAFAGRTNRRRPGDIAETISQIIEDVRDAGETAVRRYAREFDGAEPNERLYLDRNELQEAFDLLPADDRVRLRRISNRIESFAAAQLKALRTMDVPIPGGRAGHDIQPLESAGCYAPGGRYPLSSSVLMTVIPARVAGVRNIWVASPDQSRLTQAAAWIAGADGMLAAGGAQAVAALALGCGPLPPCDVIVGPGNRYVTEAKRQLSGEVRIDMLAGPSELVIIADRSADPVLVAADLLAQAEHDPDAFPLLISLDADSIQAVERELAEQLYALPSCQTARQALLNGGSVLAQDIRDAVRWCNELAPEHVQLNTRANAKIREGLTNFGALFLGQRSAEVFGDYGAGPNHVLPTGGAARSTGGLSVYTFVKVQTWMQLDYMEPLLLDDAAWLGRAEGLEAHARAAEKRRCLGG